MLQSPRRTQVGMERVSQEVACWLGGRGRYPKLTLTVIDISTADFGPAAHVKLK